MNNTFDDIRKIIEMSQSIAISGHTSPDGDCIGAAVALCKSLRLLGKDAIIVMEQFPETFDIFESSEFVFTEFEEDYLPELYISVDCGDIERLGKYGDLYNKTLHTINIDHHKSNTFFGKQNYVEDDASSASELIFRLLYGYSPIDDEVAKAIYMGIVFDTGGFRHSSTSAVTLSIAANLMEYDFDFTNIYNSIFYKRDYLEAKIIGKALEKMEKHLDGKCISSVITLEEMKNCGANKDHLSEIVNYLKTIRGSEVVIFIYEKEENYYKVSMRSEETIDVSVIGQCFGGGGHAQAAGCNFSTTPEDALAKVLDEVKKQL